MDEIKTIDELIMRLLELRERSGGNCPVMLRTYGRELLHVHCTLEAIGKNDPYHTVSRNGKPCIILGE